MSGNGGTREQRTKLELRRAALEKLRKATSDEVLKVAVRAGIYTAEGQLTEPYRADGELSASRPTD